MRLAPFVLSSLLLASLAPGKADAQLGALVRAARAAGGAGRAAGSAAGRAARIGGNAGRLGRTGAHAGAAGARATRVTAAGVTIAAAADARAARLFTSLPDEIGHGAAYLTDDLAGSYRVIAPHHADDLTGAVTDVYIDLPMARHPDRLPPLEGRNLHVLDAEGNPHAVRVVENEDGLLDYVVDAGETALDVGMDLADFAEDELDEGETEHERAMREAEAFLAANNIDLNAPPPAAVIPPQEEESGSWWKWGLGGLAFVLGGLWWIGRKPKPIG